MIRTPRVLVAIVLAALLFWHARADACGGGFSRRRPDGSVALTYNDAWRAVMMRVGLRTVLSLENSYKGPPEDFALVVPVPVVLERANVRTLPAGTFERIDRLSSPRLYELYEVDPCVGAEREAAYSSDNKEGGTGTRAKGEDGAMGAPRVKVEAEFSVDEYDVVVLSATESTALETWLTDNGYGIPPGAEPYLRPYVVGGSKFFVAKVNVSRVKFRWGRAVLSPLRFHYDAPAFTLPTRLGLINSSGVQELFVYVLGTSRYETSNYENVAIPTKLDIKEEAGAAFDSFYASLFAQHAKPGAVVTEYAAPADTCELCPDGAAPLSHEDALALGADVIGTNERLVLTRLHTRYTRETLGEDLVFKPAQAPDTFVPRYTVRHPWRDAVECTRPVFGSWRAALPEEVHQRARASPVTREMDAKAQILAPGDVASAGGSAFGRAVKGMTRAVLESRAGRGWSNVVVVVATPLIVAFVARRRRMRVLPALGLLVLLFVACVVASLAANDPRHLRIDRLFVGTIAGVPLTLGLAVGAAVVVCARRRATLLLGALAPAIGAFVECGRQARFVDSALAGDLFDLDQSARIFAESAAEMLEPLYAGALRAGLLLTIAAVLAARELAHARATVKAVAPVVAIAIVARIFAGSDAGVIDGVAVVAIAAAAVTIDRARARLPEAPAIAIAFVAAVLLLDLAARARTQSVGLGAIAGESVDAAQRARILHEIIVRAHVRVAIACVDVALLAAFTFVRAGRFSMRSGEAIAVSVVCAVAVAAVPTMLVWTGAADRIASVGRVASRAAWTAGAAVDRSARDLDRAQTSALAGPSLVVDDARLLGAPSFEASVAPFGPELVEQVAKAGGATPLLIAPGGAPMSSVTAALAPLLAQQQTDFRLAPRVDPHAELGVYGLLVAATEIDVTPVELIASPVIHPAARDAIRGAAFVLDGEVLRMFSVRRDAAGFADGDVALAGRFDLDGSDREVVAAVTNEASAAFALLAVAPETPVASLARALARIGRMRAPRHGMGWPNEPLFRRYVVTTARAAFDAMRPSR